MQDIPLSHPCVVSYLYALTIARFLWVYLKKNGTLKKYILLKNTLSRQIFAAFVA